MVDLLISPLRRFPLSPLRLFPISRYLCLPLQLISPRHQRPLEDVRIIVIRCRSVEKRRAHFDLSTVKRLAKNPASRLITRQAFKDAAVLGLEENDIAECVAQLTQHDFYKSMTVYTNSQLWQDVYHPTHQETALYVKVQLDPTEETVVIVSCKAR